VVKPVEVSYSATIDSRPIPAKAVARSQPEGDQCVASSSGHIHTSFHRRGRFDNAGRWRSAVAKQTDGGKIVRRVAARCHVCPSLSYGPGFVACAVLKE
jgi:hypothetical protein